MATNSLKWLALLGGVTLGSATMAVAQDSGPLIDTLVKKGILTDQEGEDLRVELLKDFGTSSAGKMEISSAVTKLKIAGDARVRYQYDNEQSNPAGAAGDKDRNRYRYRVRLGFQADLGPKWTAALRLETASGATSTNGDLGNGTDNFDKTGDVAYFGQAYLNYHDVGVLGADSIDVRLGKLPHKFFNPGVNGFWIDSDINFEGAAQEIVYGDIGLKDSTLALRAGQFVLNNNAANAGATTNSSVDPSLLLMGQVEYATKKWKIAPTVVAFAAPSAHDITATTALLQSNDTAVYNDLVTVLVPFEYTFKLGAKPAAVYATYGYNLKGEERAHRLAQAATPAAKALVDDDSQIYNLGVRYGENKLAGDYQLVGEYRHVGNGSYSSLLLDSDFNGGFLNGEGFILSGSYSLTSAVTATVTYFNSFNIEENRAAGGSANRGNGFGEAQVLQIDLSAKF
jgi:polyhydroxyalkanoate synthesis regulator phasin